MICNSTPLFVRQAGQIVKAVRGRVWRVGRFGACDPVFFSPECVARVPVSLWACGGWAVFARRCETVRNRSREGRMAVPMVSSAKGVAFGGFQRCVASFRVAGVALCDIPTCFMTCQKWFCVAGAILLLCFQKMRWIFRCRRSTLDTSHVILPGRHSTLDVFLRIAMWGLRDVVTLTTPQSLHSTLYTLHNLNSTFHTLHFTLHSLHPTLYTPHSTLYTLHPTFQTPRFTLYTPHFKLHIPRSTHYTFRSTLQT